MGESAKIYTIFLSSGYGGAGELPAHLLTNDQLLRNLRDRLAKAGSGACSQVELPVGETVTVWKIDVINQRMLIHTGTSVDGRVLYPREFDDIMCRTKLVVKTEAKNVQRHFYMDEYGLHRAAPLVTCENR